MLPEMPRCKSSTTFHSARLADVYSAFFILIAGGIVAIFIWIIERIWHKRRQMKETIVRRVRQRRLMPSHLPYLPHFKSFSHFPFQSQLHSYNDPRSEFSHDHDCKHNSSINNDYLASKLSISTKHSRKEISLKKRKEKNDYIDSDEDIDRSRYESKFFTWKRYSNLKRANWNQFSEFPRSKLDKNKIDRLKDNIIFPFHH